jgi:OFA family oxalate/formate antiporter-like MFS transporter
MRFAPVVVLACVIGLMFSISPAFLATMSVFIKPLAGEFGWGRTQVSAAISISTLGLAVCSPLLGPWIDRYGPRRVILVATTLLAGSIASLSALNGNYATYLLIAAAIGITGAGSNAFVYLSVLPNWFDRRYGLSLGIAMLGIGLGQLAAPLYANAFITEYGWRTAYLLIAVLILAITVPNALFLLRDRPSDGVVLRRQPVFDDSGVTRSQAVRMPVFWLLSFSFFFITVAASGCIVHLVPMLTDRGVSQSSAAALAALIGSSLMVGRLVTGVLLDYISAALIGLVSFTGCALGIAMFLLGPSGFEIPLGIVLIGTAFGVEGDLMAYMVRRIFGMREYGAVYGLMFGIFNAGIVIGPPLMGASFDTTKSYSNGLAAMLVMSAVSLVLLALASRRSRVAIVTDARIQGSA